MHCPKCRRELGEGQSVYQTYVAWGSYGSVTSGHVCAPCLKAMKGQWSSSRHGARPCGNCGRPVINLARRQQPKLIACSPQCRQTLHNARYRKRHARPRPAAVCVVCARSFTPKRRDARYCSAACKQKGWRRKA